MVSSPTHGLLVKMAALQVIYRKTTDLCMIFQIWCTFNFQNDVGICKYPVNNIINSIALEFVAIEVLQI